MATRSRPTCVQDCPAAAAIDGVLPVASTLHTLVNGCAPTPGSPPRGEAAHRAMAATMRAACCHAAQQLFDGRAASRGDGSAGGPGAPDSAQAAVPSSIAPTARATSFAATLASATAAVAAADARAAGRPAPPVSEPPLPAPGPSRRRAFNRATARALCVVVALARGCALDPVSSTAELQARMRADVGRVACRLCEHVKPIAQRLWLTTPQWRSLSEAVVQCLAARRVRLSVLNVPFHLPFVHLTVLIGQCRFRGVPAAGASYMMLSAELLKTPTLAPVAEHDSLIAKRHAAPSSEQIHMRQVTAGSPA